MEIKRFSKCIVSSLYLLFLSFTPLTSQAAEHGLGIRPSNTSCLAPDRPPSTTLISLERVVTLPTTPMAMVQSPFDSKWFVLSRTGTVTLYDDGPSFSEIGVILDIQDRVTTTYDGNPAEFGALGIAPHPNYRENGEVYIYYTTFDQGSIARLSRFTSLPNGLLDPSSEQILLSLPLSNGIHVGGNIAFGPDDYLYIGTGDNGIHSIGGDGSSQDTFSLMGKMLRIDVNGLSPYEIPPDNPFADAKLGAPEVYAWGLRNPWRWSFDKETANIWLGDVGHTEWEEIDLIRKGGNYGWPIREGAHCWRTDFCETAGLLDPIFEFPHPEGLSAIIGGFVYRGSSIPVLRGIYVYADRYSSLFALRQDEQGNQISDTLLESHGGITSFAEAKDGELYILQPTSISRLVTTGESPQSTFPNKLSQTGCFESGDATKPRSGLIPYDVNAPLWSDGAKKERWMALPDGKKISVNSEGDWEFPISSVLIKNFRQANKLIETRLFVRHDDGEWAGYSYEWNDSQTDATLLPGSKNKRINDLTYQFPSRSECLQCHTSVAGRSLGLETAQLNRNFTYPSTGITANQISTFIHIGLFDSNLGSIRDLPKLAKPFSKGPIDKRARAYLHANCAMCHQPGGPGQGPEDFRFSIAGEDMGVVMEIPTQGELGITDAVLLFPGYPEKSIISTRIHTLDLSRMPPLATNVVDRAGTKLVDNWIRSGLGLGVPDTDSDGFADNVDNCIEIRNSNQIDSDSDGYGNNCDADLNNDNIVNSADLARFRSFFGSRNTGLAADFNGDDFVNTSDLAIFRSFFGRKPGPSGSVLPINSHKQ